MLNIAQTTERLSICGSLTAGIYQLYLGFLYEGADGFSPLLLGGWLLGDMLNIIGTVWGRQMFFQQVIACCSLVTDLMLMWQHWYYSEKRAKANLSSISNLSNLTTRMSPIIVASTLRTVGATNTFASRELSAYLSDSTEYIIGQGFSWIAESFYVCALIPQVRDNFRRKCTGSVSVVMFLADFVSSFNYLASILVSSSSNSNPVEFILEELPYIVGSAACCLFDIILLTQYYVYPQFLVSDTIQAREQNEPDENTLLLTPK